MAEIRYPPDQQPGRPDPAADMARVIALLIGVGVGLIWWPRADLPLRPADFGMSDGDVSSWGWRLVAAGPVLGVLSWAWRNPLKVWGGVLAVCRLGWRAARVVLVSVGGGEERGAPATRERSNITEAGGRLDLDSPFAPDCPPLSILPSPERARGRPSEGRGVAADIVSILATKLRLPVALQEVVVGPAVVTVSVQPGEDVQGNAVRPTAIIRAAADLAGFLGVPGVRAYTDPVHRGCVAIEVARETTDVIRLREAAASPAFRGATGGLPMLVGLDTRRRTEVFDFTRAPHALAAGTTKSGKSVAINTLLCSLLLRLPPERLRIVIVDPKRVDFAPYRGLPHLAAPVLHDPEEALGAFAWLVTEMERRYKLLEARGVQKIEDLPAEGRPPYILLVVDEFADLVAAIPGKKELESFFRLLQRLLQKARAAGIHCVIATQRPKAEILPRLLTDNAPVRLALRVQNALASSLILGEGQDGAAYLRGYGDLLFLREDGSIVRLQAPLTERGEVAPLVAWWRDRYGDPAYLWAPGPGSHSAASGPGNAPPEPLWADAEEEEEGEYSLVEFVEDEDEEGR